MNVILTVKKKDDLINGERVLEFEDKVFKLDVSLKAQMRWEQKFPEQAKNEELLIYAERIQNIDAKNISVAKILSQMKVLYCYFDFDLSFSEFVQMFDTTIPKHTNKLIEQIQTAFEIIGAGASEKN